MMPARFSRGLLVERRGGIEAGDLTKIGPQRHQNGIGHVGKIDCHRGRTLYRHEPAVLNETADLDEGKTASDLRSIEREPLRRLRPTQDLQQSVYEHVAAYAEHIQDPDRLLGRRHGWSPNAATPGGFSAPDPDAGCVTVGFADNASSKACEPGTGAGRMVSD